MLNGYVRVRGTMGRPRGRIDLSLHVPQPGEEHPLRLALVGQLDTREAAGPGNALSDSITALAGDISPLLGTGLRAALVLDEGPERLLRGGLTLPMAWTDQRIEIAPPGREADFRIGSEALPLETLASFLPPRAGLTGNLNLSFRAHGGIEDPELSGKIRSTQTTLTLRNGLRVTSKTSLDLAGSARAPELTGSIVVLSGVIPIPESPAERHPVQGSALLWNLESYAPASPDSIADGSSRNPAAAPPPRIHPKLDVTIQVPTGLWIRGRDLNVELTGDLRLRMENEVPIVVGNLKARSGTLTLLGRSFDVSSGTVTFYGEETVNPRLDIVMESRISTTLVKVLVTGTAEKPELKLTSEPEMSETDILSLIVFGRSSTDLNGDEVQLMTKQAATMAAVYGTAGLTQSLSRELGVDMLTINPSGGSSGQSTVVVGKYLDPRTLIKYEQTLQGVSEFFVTLQYRLTNYLTVETLVGATQSGAGVSWTRDY
jgi:translocation and assembly module TamB